jgi:hypothetical protein
LSFCDFQRKSMFFWSFHSSFSLHLSCRRLNGNNITRLPDGIFANSSNLTTVYGLDWFVHVIELGCGVAGLIIPSRAKGFLTGRRSLHTNLLTSLPEVLFFNCTNLQQVFDMRKFLLGRTSSCWARDLSTNALTRLPGMLFLRNAQLRYMWVVKALLFQKNRCCTLLLSNAVL